MPDFEDNTGKEKKKSHPSHYYEPGTEANSSGEHNKEHKPSQPSSAQKSNLRSRWKPAKRASNQPHQDERPPAKSEDLHIPQKNFIEEVSEFQKEHPEAVTNPESLFNEDDSSEEKPAYVQRDRPSYDRKPRQPREAREPREREDYPRQAPRERQSRERDEYSRDDQQQPDRERRSNRNRQPREREERSAQSSRDDQPGRERQSNRERQPGREHHHKRQPQRPSNFFQFVKATFFKLIGRKEKEEEKQYRPYDQRRRRPYSSRKQGGGPRKNYNRPNNRDRSGDRHKPDGHNRPPRKQQGPDAN
ncbi:MAG: hypothetical protein COZ46_00710 [Verrucomicrobia bacterium CG_4_10_14_3_um_filter_43_23]|nr:MAG: hypothetical protein AUJ82_02120 [Verrucomicrobia bacterium CG1_02_43_26]PIP59743.1 MAG: hypothetical protein COX01_02240 [Verrucomicrobia bacterium CG22_combo_CG10-13_8_21_14_all_43_17]PIX59057.1 MAG: hypothetical protein COZ46_00710 [Verrucomicrobia bacterium CG_4_10_14_3_um_filter_43_23]PIY62546.1 MAG: hypothetical protein COY94_01950 [Verrucomicrobia bacterium CG_4_10_14_0_8_um_filter_43_34]PJA44634.1 MAG: hypothetical protein CO175_01675 [Verrucomicrobia bacterium CG_4_9_14_3_um_fi